MSDDELRKRMIATADYLDGLASKLEKYEVRRFSGPLAKDIIAAVEDCRLAANNLRSAAESS